LALDDQNGVAAVARSDPYLGAEVAQELSVGAAAQRALGYLKNGKYLEAQSICASILQVEPGKADVLHIMAASLHDAADYELAGEYIDRAIEAEPANPAQFRTKARILLEIDDLDGAFAAAKRAVELAPRNANLLSAMADICYERADYRAAVPYLRRALACNPDHAPAHMVMGNVLAALVRFEESDACFQRCDVLRPSQPQNWVNRGLALMRAGALQRGLEAFEWRWKWEKFSTRRPPVAAPRWRGEKLSGGKILLWAEQGLGDTLQHVRFAAWLREHCDEVVLTGGKRTWRLLSTAPGVDRMITVDRESLDHEAFDAWVPAMSLPLIKGTTIETIPCEVPYLTPPATTHPVVAERLQVDGLKVGCAWTGNAEHRHNRHRSIPADALRPLTEMEGVTAFRLQREVDSRNAYDSGGLELKDLEPDDGDLADAASAVAGLDLVITVDTSVAHIAGALGKPCWILLSYASDYRWLTGRDDSPWYPSVRLFRQPEPGDWKSVIEAVKAALAEKLPA
jgi:tetratricopeptide (TPR) repeat protein